MLLMSVAMPFIHVAGLLLSLLVPGSQRASDPTADVVAHLAAASTESARKAIIDAHADALTKDFQRALTGKGIELRRVGNFDGAANAFLASIEVARRRSDDVALANALINYSSIPGQQADYTTAIAALNEALAIGERTKHADSISGALANLAIVYRLTGDYDRAIETNLKAMELASAAKDRYTLGRIWSNLGVVYWTQGRYREALDAYTKAITFKESTSDADIALTLNNIGTIHINQGNTELALEYFTRSLNALRAQGGDNAGTASELSNIGAVYRQEGNLDKAADYFAQALAINERLGSKIGISTSTYNLASVQRLKGNKPQALAGYQKSLELQTAINDRAGMAESLSAVAHLHTEMGQPSEGLDAAERAAAVARELKSDELLSDALMALGDARHELRDAVRAEAAYRDAIEAIEHVRAEVAGGAESRQRFLADHLEAYHNLAKTLLEQDKIPEAFAVAERLRGRALADVLQGSNAVVRPLTVEEREKLRTLEQGVVAANARLRVVERKPQRDAAQMHDANERLRKARLLHDEYRDALDARYPVRRLARGDYDPQALATMWDLVADGRTAILEYLVTESATYLFVATQDGLSQFPLRVRHPELTAKVGAFTRKLANRALDFHADAQAVYDLLIKPAAAAIGGRTHLIVVPDDVLWTIPFEALESSHDHAIIDAAAVSYAPSLMLLCAMHQRHESL